MKKLFLIVTLMFFAATPSFAEDFYQYDTMERDGYGPFQGVYAAIDGHIDLAICGVDEPFDRDCYFAKYCDAYVSDLTPDGEMTVCAVTCYGSIPVLLVFSGGHEVEQ